VDAGERVDTERPARVGRPLYIITDLEKGGWATVPGTWAPVTGPGPSSRP
jgi:hypothetical protein